MLKKSTFLGTIAGIGFSLGTISGAFAAKMPAQHSTQSTQFRHIEQPLTNKVFVTLGGLTLISLELWWFLLSKPQSKKV